MLYVKNEHAPPPAERCRSQRVRTAAVLTERNFTEPALAGRRPNTTGTTCGYQTEFGLCYHVRHDDGSYGWYDPDELEDL